MARGFAFFHHPLYSSAAAHGSSKELRDILEPLFQKYGVQAVFSGHDHVYERILPQKGILYFTEVIIGATSTRRRVRVPSSPPYLQVLTKKPEANRGRLARYINATVGFPKLAARTKIHVKTLHQMFGPNGNPTARNLFDIVAYLQHAEGVRFEVRSTRAAFRIKQRLAP